MEKRNLLITIIAIFGSVVISNAQVPNYIPTNGLVGWWPFNGDAVDESPNTNDGTVNGAILTADRYNNANKAFNFNGTSDYISVIDNPSLSVSNVTISAWYYAYDYGTAGTNGQLWQGHIVSKREISGWGNSFQLALESTTPTNGIWATYTIGGNGWVSYNSNVDLITNDWINITYTHDNNFAKLYVNGILVGTTIVTGGLSSNNLPMWFGARPFAGGNSSFFHGKLDDIGIWNRALTQQEISNLYNATNCSNNLTISPATNQLEIGSTANFVATTSDTFPSYVWQSDFGQGFQTLNNYGNYSGVNSNSLSISNVQLSEHNQPIRVISTSGECIDTSDVATINITDTCIVTINDTITTLISVTDTLVINTLITGLTPPNNSNTIKVFPNPANSHITIDFGNFESMNGYTLTITNSIGQTVYTTPINEQSSYVDLSTWSGNGIYFVQIIDSQNNTIENRKIVLQ